MNITPTEVTKVVESLPIGYYAFNRIPLEASTEADKSKFVIDERKIVISVPNVVEKLASLPDDCGITEESAIRNQVYHEVSHALHTPTYYKDELTTQLNIMEDARVEKFFKDYYLDVDFDKFNKANPISGIDPKEKDAQALEYLHNLVRKGEGDPTLLKRAQDILNRYVNMDMTENANPNSGTCYHPDRERFIRDVNDLFTEVKKFVKTMPPMGGDGDGDENSDENGDADGNPKGGSSKGKGKGKDGSSSGSGNSSSDGDDPSDGESNGNSGDLEGADRPKGEDGDGNGDGNSNDSGNGEDDGKDGEADGEGKSAHGNAQGDSKESEMSEAEAEAERKRREAIRNQVNKQLRDMIDSLHRNRMEVEEDTHLTESIERIIENFHKKNNSGSALASYSGHINPRYCAREDYRFFEKKSPINGANRYGTCNIILWIDVSGSMSGATEQLNQLLKSMKVVAHKHHDFTFSLVVCGEGQRIRDVDDECFVQCTGGNSIHDDVFDQYKSLQKPNTMNYNIALFDGDAFSDGGAESNFGVFNHPNCLIVTDDDNERYAKRYCQQARVQYCDHNYAEELKGRVLDMMSMAFR